MYTRTHKHTRTHACTHTHTHAHTHTHTHTQTQTHTQWWKTDGTHLKTVLLKGTFGKYIKFSPDFTTFVTIDNAGLLYILTSLTE